MVARHVGYVGVQLGLRCLIHVGFGSRWRKRKDRMPIPFSHCFSFTRRGPRVRQLFVILTAAGVVSKALNYFKRLR